MIEQVSGGLLQGYLHSPEGPADTVVILAHGAGSDCNSRLLVALASAVSAAGLFALRLDLPFRQRRPSGPPPPSSAARDREGLREAVRFCRSRGLARVILGGHSYGGRQASMLTADEPDLASRLLLLSYPLHPPRNSDTLRTAHFPRLRTPVLFVHGTRDPFGSPDEMRSAVALIPAQSDLFLVTNAAHELKPVIQNPRMVLERLYSLTAGAST